MIPTWSLRFWPLEATRAWSLAVFEMHVAPWEGIKTVLTNLVGIWQNEAGQAVQVGNPTQPKKSLDSYPKATLQVMS